jgi:hypothetical protein
MKTELEKTYGTGNVTVEAKGDSYIVTIAGESYTIGNVQYTVNFYDEDGTTLLKSVTVDANETASYGDSTPTKAGDDTNTYTFSKWVTEIGGTTEADLTNIKSSMNVYAVFKTSSGSTNTSPTTTTREPIPSP